MQTKERIMGEYADIYAIVDERTVKSINALLDEFLPERQVWEEEWSIREYPYEPFKLFTDVDEVLRYCCEYKHVTQYVRWRHIRTHVPQFAVVNFLIDGHVIFGVSTPSEHLHRVKEISRQLAEFSADSRVILAYETSPPNTVKEFAKLYESVPEADDGATVRDIGCHA